MDRCTLRSHSWDGPAPAAGDLLVTRAGSWYLVVDVREGAGVGHYAMTCERLGKDRPVEADDLGRAVYRWTWAPRRRSVDRCRP